MRHPVRADASCLCKTLLVWDALKLPENKTLFWPGRIPTLWVLFEIFFHPPAAWDKVVCAARVMTAHELLPSNTSSPTRQTPLGKRLASFRLTGSAKIWAASFSCSRSSVVRRRTLKGVSCSSIAACWTLTWERENGDEDSYRGQDMQIVSPSCFSWIINPAPLSGGNLRSSCHWPARLTAEEFLANSLSFPCARCTLADSTLQSLIS